MTQPKAYYNGSAEGQNWACVEGSDEHTDAEAIEAAQSAYGGSWLMPVFKKRPEDWPTNPKTSNNGLKKLWLLVKG